MCVASPQAKFCHTTLSYSCTSDHCSSTTNSTTLPVKGNSWLLQPVLPEIAPRREVLQLEYRLVLGSGEVQYIRQISVNTKLDGKVIEGFSCKPKFALQTGLALSPSLSHAKPLDCIPKTSPQGPLPYLATDSFLRMITEVQLSKFIIWLLLDPLGY